MDEETSSWVYLNGEYLEGMEQVLDPGLVGDGMRAVGGDGSQHLISNDGMYRTRTES